MFAAEQHVELGATWGISHGMVAAYREPDTTQGRTLMENLIESVGHGVPAALTEPVTLGRTMKKRAALVLLHLQRPVTE